MKAFWWGQEPVGLNYTQRQLWVVNTDETGFPNIEQVHDHKDIALNGLLDNGYIEISYRTAAMFGWPS